MDEGDEAGRVSDFFLDLAVAAARQQQDSLAPSLSHCIDCDIDIEPQRQRLAGVTRCAECAGFHVQEQRQKGLTA